MEELKYCYKYPRPAVTTDCVIFGLEGKNLNVLLIKRGNEPFKDKWAFPGGFLNMNETAEEGALRELKEETGLESVFLEQFHTYSDVNRDPRERVISIAFLTLVKIQEVKGGDDAKEARWFSVNEMPELAFDHELIFKDAFSRLQEMVQRSPDGNDIFPANLINQELQK